MGYIGLPTAALLASKGINVIGVDIDQKIVNEVNSNTKIVEPGLSELINLAKKAGKLRATQFPESLIAL